MADSAKFSFLLYLLMIFFLADVSVSLDPPQISPSPSSPSPHSDADSPSSGAPQHAPAPLVDALQHAPSSSPLPSSPPAPTPENPSPAVSPMPASSPSPAPADSSEVNHSGVGDASSKEEDSSGGMSGGKKAGIAVGVIVAAGVVGLAWLVYKKRQQNIRRSQYGNAARREIL